MTEIKGELEQKIEQLSLAFAQLSDPIIITDSNFNVVSVNKPFEELYGYTLEELTGNTPDLLNAEPMSEDIQQDIYATVAEGNIWNGSALNARKDGSTFDCEMTISTLTDEQGKPFAYIGTHKDVTEQKQIEEDLRENKKRLELVLEGGGVGYWDWNIKTGECVFDERWQGMLGYSIGDIQQNFDTWGGLLFPDDKPRIISQLEAHFEDPTVIYDPEMRLKTKSGDYKWIRGKGKVVEWDEEGNPLRMAGIHIDITERKQAEEEMKKAYAAIETSPNATFTSDLEGRVTYANSAAARMWGFENHDDMMGTEVMGYWAEKSREKAKEVIGILMKEGSYSGEGLIGKRKDGTEFLVEANSAILEDASGKPVGMTSSFSDITERKQAEEEVKQKTHDLGERVKELNCLYGLAEIIETPGISLEDIFQKTVDLIPISWGYPDIACAKISYEDQTYRMDRCLEDVCAECDGDVQKADIMINGEKKGTITVKYREKMPEAAEGPFSKEERSLINALAERVGRVAERIQAEQEIKYLKEYNENIIESSPNSIVIVKGSQIEYVNSSFIDAFGGTKEDYVPRDLKESILSDTVSTLEEMLQNHTGTGELEINDRAYSVKTFTVVKAEEEEEEEEEARKGIILQDITEQKKTEAKLIEAQKMDSIGNLAGGIAHDYNNLLSASMGYSDMLRIIEDDPTKKEYAEKIYQVNERMRDLTRKLLGFARRSDTIKQAVNLNQVVNEVYTMLELHENNIKIETNLGDLVTIDADYGQMTQVLMNLGVNINA